MVDVSTAFVVFTGVVMSEARSAVSTEQLLRRLSGHPHLAAYDKRHLPKRLHYANNIRIDDVIITMDDEWVVSRSVHRP